MEEWLTAEQVGAMFGCGRRRICTLARSDRLIGSQVPCSRSRGGKRWRFASADVRQFMDSPEYGLRLVSTLPITATRDDLLWFAGFFDGEGCVTIQARAGGGAGWHLSIILPNTARRLVEDLPRLFGGSCHPIKLQGHQTMIQTRWRASGRQAGLILKTIVPYLRVKDRQAGLGIEFQERVDRSSSNGHRPISPEEREWRDAAYRRMQWLNHHYE